MVAKVVSPLIDRCFFIHITIMVLGMSRQNSFGKRLAFFFIYVLIGVVASYFFSWLTQLYVELFGETYTPGSKLLASTVCLIVCLIVIFMINHYSVKLNAKFLGLSLALLMFISLYIVGPGVRAPITLYITSVSFPYNINMLALLTLPWVSGRILHRYTNRS